MKFAEAQSRIHQTINIMAEIAHAENAAACKRITESSNRRFGQWMRHLVARQLRIRSERNGDPNKRGELMNVEVME